MLAAQKENLLQKARSPKAVMERLPRDLLLSNQPLRMRLKKSKNAFHKVSAKKLHHYPSLSNPWVLVLLIYLF